AIDQGPIIVMIENYRTQLCWNLFMANPEISPMLESIGWAVKAGNGLNYEYYHGVWDSLPDFDSLTPESEGTVCNFNITERDRDDYFAFRFTGYIEIPENGWYRFCTTSDDGSKLYIDDTLVVDNDGLHGMVEECTYIELTAGKHPITVTYFEKDGEEDLIVSYSGPGVSSGQVSSGVLFRCNLDGDFNEDCHVDMDDLRILAVDWLNTYTYVDFAEMAANWMK
ncbi:MAG TPA: hypothetical protein ENG51_21260, partial [Deltaproteobacteria bacterium]|nr:hypothetical protein [Deltaproteobacteria bacterium]